MIFYDKKINYEQTKIIEKQLIKEYPQYKWELKNQVYMHRHSPNTAPYAHSCDAISKFPEKCTAVGARLIENDLEIFAPYGIEDIIQYLVRPTEHFLKDKDRRQLYNARVKSKNWQAKWPNLTITSI